MQPKLKSKVRCADRAVGEVTRIIVDPLSREVSHIVMGDGAGALERQIPAAQVETVTEDAVQLRGTSSEMAQFPAFQREGYVTIREVEIAHLEDHLHVEPGEVLVPVPELERNVKRRTFFTNFKRNTAPAAGSSCPARCSGRRYRRCAPPRRCGCPGCAG